MAIEWNFLNPYMRPLSENLMAGVNQGLGWRQHQQDLGERKRQFDAGSAYRQALLQNMQQQVAQRRAAQQAYNWASGGSGQMFQQPYTKEKANELLFNPFVTNYLGLPTAQTQKQEAMVNIPGYGQLPAQYGYHYLKDQPKPDENWGPIQYDKYGHAYVVNKSTGETKSLWGAPGQGGSGSGEKEYTIQQMIDDNENHYAKELIQRTKAMVDEFGLVIPEYRDQFVAIQQELLKKKQDDFYKIQQGQRPSWLTGSDNPEQIQQRYNQLRQQGLTPAQIAEQMRKEGIPIE